ncbi:MAG: MG2 domain-containing protein, partial [Saprospiraceae bacterium]|nr:MG2 domain-containing protein [Saprospiraceae bacterium]
MTRLLSLTTLLLAVLMTACEPKSKKTELTTLDYQEASEVYKEYITAYSDGILSRTSPIQVRFTTPIVEQNQIGETAPSEILQISPAIEGTAVWETRYKLKFTPKNWLPSNQKYTVQVNLDQLYSKDDLKVDQPFSFEFKVRQQAYEVDIRGFRDQNADDFDMIRLQGKVKTADAAKQDEVEKILKIDKDKYPEMVVVWTHPSNSYDHLFELQNIKRTNKEGSDLLLEWDGEAIGVNRQLVDTFEIPSYNFEVIGAKVVQEQEPYILIQYSTPLKQVQDLTGLVDIQGYSYGHETVIDGSELRIYPSGNIEGAYTIVLAGSIKNAKGESGDLSEWELYFEDIKPQVRLVGDGGTIIPKSEGLYFPFEAVNLKAVDVEIFKVYENNVLQFLQDQQINDDYKLSYVGKIIKQQRIFLQEKEPMADLAQWTRYHLDLNDMIQQEPGAIYQVRISFRKSYATYKCNGEDVGATELKKMNDGFDMNEDGEYISFFSQFNYYNYDYDLRKDPCYEDYYNHRRFIKHNVMASNLGIVAKRTEDRACFVAVTDLLTTQPIADVEITLYDYQQQPIASTRTGEDGTILFKLTDKTKPFVLVAAHQGQKGYLKILDGYNLPMSRFEVSGTRPYKGIKGEIYGERGVWRPGDSLYLTLVLEDEQAHLPKHHPVTFELSDPQGRLYEKRVVAENLNGMYSFHTNTRMDAPTGNWRLNATIGGVSFSKPIKIETVKPNRLKIETTLEEKKQLYAKDINLSTQLNLRWLHGAIAKNLKASVDLSLSSIGTNFEGFRKYEFDDPARPAYSSEEMNLFSDKVDENGKAEIKAQLLDEDVPPPGFLRAGFTIRAFEKGGDASVDNFYLSLSPFTHYVGVKVPKNKYQENRLGIEKTSEVEVVSLDEQGEPAANRKLTVGIYRLEWSWWWDRQEENLNKFNSMKHTKAVEQLELTTDAQGKGILSIEPKSWGRYMLRVCDSISGHCSGEIYYAGSPWDDGNTANKKNASMLIFNTDKKKYTVGEEVTLQIPTGSTGRALLTLENGTDIIKHDWIDIQKNETGLQEYKFNVNADMAPNIYAHITLMQPHAQTLNDLPIRSYGVIPIMVEDPATHLKPVLDMPNELAPNSTVALNIKEETGKAMTYTIAIVDEGLLDLTNYKTPDLWETFYSKEALGIRTWDMYDYVLGAYGDQLDRILSIGGGAADDADEAKKAIRFKPMVRFLGPFELKAGAAATHQVEIPNYIGSVRTMVVAGHKSAYGKVDKVTPVKTPLMVLATLPRVLSPTEEIKLPVTLFAMDDKIKEVEVEVKTNDLTRVQGLTKQKISFDRSGEKMVFFDLTVNDMAGIATFDIIAKSGKEKAKYTMEIDVRNPNPYITKVSSQVVEDKSSWQTSFKTIGTKGTNGVLLEVSSIPPINLNKRLEYLIRYPHGCIEQTTSSGFPQLVVSNLTPLDEDKKNEIEKNINATILRI